MSSLTNAKAQQTARHAIMLRAVGQGGRRRRLPRQIYPKSIESEYARTIVGVLEAARPLLAPLLHDLPGMLASATAERRGDRTDAGEPERVKRLIDQTRQQLEQRLPGPEIERLAELFGKRTQSYQRVQLGRQVRAVLGVDVAAGDGPRMSALLAHFTHENAVLIKSVPADFISDVEKRVARAFTSGTRHEEIAADLVERYGIAENRARLIARDQVGKLYGQTNAVRQQDLGIQRFTWRTAGDERVREEHQELDGQEFSYDEPPDEGLPGEPIQCRCYAEPVMSLIASAVDDADA